MVFSWKGIISILPTGACNIGKIDTIWSIEIPYSCKIEIQESKLINDWDRLKNNADKDNNTFKSQNLFKVAYDTSDIDVNYSNYLKMRKPLLEQKEQKQQRSYTIENNYDNKSNRNKNFRNGNVLSKSIDKMYSNNNNQFKNRIDYHMKFNNMDKDLFFGTPKAILNKNKKNG